jgi:hypothetical protein
MSRRRRIAWTVLVLLAALVAVGSYEYRQSSHSTPVSEQRALDRYRSLQGSQPETGVPAPGIYRYAVTGWECAGVGPLCLRRQLPASAYLIVTRGPETLQMEFDFSAEHREAIRYRLTAGARYETWQDTYLSFVGVAQDDAAATVPATLALPASPRVGQRWTQVFHVGSLPVHGTNRVLRREQVTVAGRTLDTLVIRSDSVTGGAHAGTEHDVAWHAQGLGLDVRQTVSRRIGGAFPYRLEASATLAQFSPSR